MDLAFTWHLHLTAEQLTRCRLRRDEGCPSSDPACAEPHNRCADTRIADTIRRRSYSAIRRGRLVHRWRWRDLV